MVGAAIAVSCTLLGQPRIGTPMPPIPPLPSVAIITNGAKAFEVRVVELPAPKVDMPPALPVSSNAPHHYYGVIEFRGTKVGPEVENEVFHFGLYPDDETFRRSHGVGNAKFTRKYRAVIKYPSELPLDILCIWQRRDGFYP